VIRTRRDYDDRLFKKNRLGVPVLYDVFNCIRNGNVVRGNADQTTHHAMHETLAVSKAAVSQSKAAGIFTKSKMLHLPVEPAEF
jgi:hypothetical protein